MTQFAILDAAHPWRSTGRYASQISPVIGVSRSPKPRQLRHRQDVERRPAHAPSLQMTRPAMLIPRFPDSSQGDAHSTDLARDPNPALTRATATASSGDAERRPAHALPLLMTLFTMLEGAPGTLLRATEGANAD